MTGGGTPWTVIIRLWCRRGDPGYQKEDHDAAEEGCVGVILAGSEKF